MVTAFVISYAIMIAYEGRIIDWLGTRWGIRLPCWYGAFHQWRIHLRERRFISRCPVRSRHRRGRKFPGCDQDCGRVVSETGASPGNRHLQHLGAIVAPLLVPFIAALFGWRTLFLVTGGLDLIWIAV